MVTAVLPSVTASREDYLHGSANCSDSRDCECCDVPTAHSRQGSTVTSISSERTITQRSFQSQPSSALVECEARPKGSPSKLAGFVGTLTGCGALLALFVFLPLPARFEKSGMSPAESVKRSFYVVALVALVISVVCFFGLRHLEDDRGKSFKALVQSFNTANKQPEISRTTPSQDRLIGHPPRSNSRYPISVVRSYFAQLAFAFTSGFKNANIGLGYLGGFVARASSVGISLFIPLYVNQYYRSSGLCHEARSFGGVSALDESDLGDIKASCPRAYIVASILTGASQLVALLCAPAFGFLSERTRLCDFPLLFAACSGIVGYILLALLPSPQIGRSHGNAAIFIDMAFIGISQIGAIVCSLAVLGNGILAAGEKLTSNEVIQSDDSQREFHGNHLDDEYSALLPQIQAEGAQDLSHLKGSIAGMYSLFGGAGILLLTKLGGVLFDRLSPRAPFYILAVFNVFLLVAGLGHGVRQYWKARR